MVGCCFTVMLQFSTSKFSIFGGEKPLDDLLEVETIIPVSRVENEF